MPTSLFPPELLVILPSMPRRRVILYVIVPICTTILILVTLLGVVKDFDPPSPSRTPGVDFAFLRIFQAFQRFRNFIGVSSAIPSLGAGFLSPSYYERDPRGAIDIFQRGGLVVCRIYVACRDRSSQILFPFWMRKHSNILSNTCALTNFRFVHLSRLVDYQHSAAVYDWLAPHVPAPALREFVSKPLSYFYAPNNASKSKLSSSPGLQRSCYSPNDTQSKSTLCGEDPEPRISKPLFILDSAPMHPSIYTNPEFEEALQLAVRDNHATDAAILSLTSEMLVENRLCLRSIISAPSADIQAGQTPSLPTQVGASNQNSSFSEIVGQTLDEADNMIDDAINRGIQVLDSTSGEDTRRESRRPYIAFSNQSSFEEYSSGLNISTDGVLNNFLNSKTTVSATGVSNEFSHETTSADAVATSNVSSSSFGSNQQGGSPVSAESLHISPTLYEDEKLNTANTGKEEHPSNLEYYERGSDSDIGESTSVNALNAIPSFSATKDNRSALAENKGIRTPRSAKGTLGNLSETLNGPLLPTREALINTTSSNIWGGEKHLKEDRVKKSESSKTGLLQENAISYDYAMHDNEKNLSSSGIVVQQDQKSGNLEDDGESRHFPSFSQTNTSEVNYTSPSFMEKVMNETIGNNTMLHELFDTSDNMSAKLQLFSRFWPVATKDASKIDLDEEFKINGGVELFTHRSINRVEEERSNGDTYGVCRLYNACRKSDGTLLLPSWYEEFKKKIDTRCGLPRATFIPTAEFETMFRKLVEEAQIGKERLANRLTKNPELAVDLIGTRVHRAQQQHFVTDLFHDGIHSIDAILNYRSRNDSTFHRECIYRTSEPNESNEREYACKNELSYNPSLRPAFIMNDLVKTKSHATQFIRGLISMVPPQSHHGPRMVFDSQLSQSGQAGSTCFRSVLITRNGYPPQSVLNVNEKNSFYELNRLDRSSIHKPGESSLDSQNTNREQCEIKVTVLEPQIVKRSKEHPGTIENEDQVLDRAVKEVESAAASRGRKGLKLLFNRFHQDGAGVLRAAQVIQESHIVIGGNDPSMASIMFARPQTVVIEVQPFGYSTGPYKNFAKALNLTYIAVMSQPDEDTFLKCAKEKYELSWGEGVSADEMEARKNGLIRLYQDAAKKFDGSSGELDLTSRKKPDGTERKGHIPLERVCVRLQRLMVDVRKFGKLVAERAAVICEKRETSRSNGNDE